MQQFLKAADRMVLSADTKVTVRNSPDFLGDRFGRKDEIDTAAVDGALRHVGLTGSIELLGYRDSPNVFYAAQRCRPVSIIARNDDCDQLAVPVFSQRAQKDRNDVGPTPGF